MSVPFNDEEALTELIEKDSLNDALWDVIKSPEYSDHIKMVAFNMLKDLGNKIDYEVISGYFEKIGYIDSFYTIKINGEKIKKDF